MNGWHPLTNARGSCSWCCYRFEKSFAGHYIGDLARLIMLRLADEQLLFGGEKSDALLQWGTFTAQHLSDIERSAT